MFLVLGPYFFNRPILDGSMIGPSPVLKDVICLKIVGKIQCDAWHVGPFSLCGPQKMKLLVELAFLLANAFPHFVFHQTV